MKRSATTSDGQISLFGEDELMSSPAASHANRSPRQVKKKGQMTTDTSGRLCLQQFGRSVPDGSWARMFSELLIGMPGWYSSRCALTWKLKATKSNRLYFQLVASTLPTDDTGRSLLLTPTVVMTCENPESMKARIKRKGYQTGTQFGSLMSQIVYGDIPELESAKMIPTPTAQDFKCRGPKSRQQGLPDFVRQLLPTPNAVEGRKWARTYNPNSQMGKSLSALAVNDMLPTPKACDGMGGVHKVMGRTVTRPSGHTFSVGLRDLAGSGLLPTPLSTEISHAERIKQLKEMGGETMGSRKNGESRPNGLMDYLVFHELLPTPVVCLDGVYANKNPESKRHSKSIATLAYEAGGRTSQLSPLFVEEMMGFPTGWILLPFLKEPLLQSVLSPLTDGEENP